MSLTWQDIEAAKAAAVANTLETDARTYGLPPGYIKGFDLTINGDTGQLTIDTGFADVSGVFVRRDDTHIIIDEDYGTGVLELPSMRYYVYLTKEARYWVDISAPVYTKINYGYYHPTFLYRYVAEFYIDVNGKVVIATSLEQNPGQIIVVASSSYKGLNYDRICDGTRDEVEINAAITYLSETYGGGMVELTEGTFYTGAAIVPEANIVLRGRGWNSIIEKNGDFHGISKIATSGNEIDNIILRDFKITRISSDTNSKDLINFEYCDNLIIEIIFLADSKQDGIVIDYCDDYKIDKCSIDEFGRYGIKISNSYGNIFNCSLNGQNTAHTNIIYGIYLTDSFDNIVDACKVINLLSSNDLAGVFVERVSGHNTISNCSVKDVETTGGGKDCYGIWADIVTDYFVCYNNYIDNCDADTAGNGQGIRIESNDCKVADNYVIDCSGIGVYIHSNCNRILVSDNFCRANGSDTGIENTNNHNFSDSGTDNRIFGNSWNTDTFAVLETYDTGWINRSDWTNVHLGNIVLDYDNLSGTFTVGETITGGTTADTGVIVSDNGSTLVLKEVTSGGIFANNEEITGGTSGATADVNEGSGDAKNQDQNVAHNFGAPLSDLLVKVFISTDGTDANSFEIVYADRDTTTVPSYIRGVTHYMVDNNNIIVQTGADGMSFVGTSGEVLTVDAEDWYYNIIIYKLTMGTTTPLISRSGSDTYVSNTGDDFGVGTGSPQEKLSVAGNIVLLKTSGIGIKVDNTTPTFGWRDLRAEIRTRGVGATDPNDTTYIGNIKAYTFSVNDEAWIEFHIPHDYVKGTDIHLHFHWSHNSALVTGGSITLEADVTYAKGHNQAAFAATVNPTLSPNASTTQYQHMVSEVQLSATSPSATQIDTDDLEPDGLILARVYLSANNITSSGAVPDPFIHEVDVHYQSTNIATKNKAPDFYT